MQAHEFECPLILCAHKFVTGGAAPLPAQSGLLFEMKSFKSFPCQDLAVLSPFSVLGFRKSSLKGAVW